MSFSTRNEEFLQATFNGRPGVLRRIVDHGYDLGAAGVEPGDALAAIDEALWQVLQPCNNEMQRRAWGLTYDRASKAYDDGAKVAFARISAEVTRRHPEPWRAAYALTWAAGANVSDEEIAAAANIEPGLPFCPVRKARADRIDERDWRRNANERESQVDRLEAAIAPEMQRLGIDTRSSGKARQAHRNKIHEAIMDGQIERIAMWERHEMGAGL